MNNNTISQIQDCLIDEDGVFKYIQIQLKDKNTEESKVIVRGFLKYEYHRDIFKGFKNDLKKMGLIDTITHQSIGGGRINISKENKTIFVYGYSKTYGRCNHDLSCQIIKQSYPQYKIEWSDEGY